MNNSEKVARLLDLREDLVRLKRMKIKNERIVSFGGLLGFISGLVVYVMVPGWLLPKLNPYINETILDALFFLWMFGGGIFAAFYIVEMLIPEWYKNAKKELEEIAKDIDIVNASIKVTKEELLKKDDGKIVNESHHEVEAGGFGNDDAQNEEDNDLEELFKDVDVEEVEKDGVDYSGERLQRHAGKSVEESAGEPRVEYNGRMVVPKKVDWEEVNEDRKETGSRGEEIAVLAERSNLRLAGRDDLAERVRQVSIELGDGFGYDVLSFFDDGREKYIEVKSTTVSLDSPYYLSRNELGFFRDIKTMLSCAECCFVKMARQLFE